MDLIVRNARLAGLDDGPRDVGIEKGRIVAIERKLAAEGKIYDAGGRLACPGLVESHIHLDKSRVIDRCVAQERATLNPVQAIAPLKPAMTVEDVHTRAAATLERCILHGSTRMRTQVEIDPAIGLRGYEGVEALIKEYKWAIDIEICVFPQEGLISRPGTEELLVSALKRGARVLGGAPRYDKDGAGQIRRIFELAREYDVDIDMHLDVGSSAEHMDIHLVRELTDRYKRGGRVVVGHMAKLSPAARQGDGHSKESCRQRHRRDGPPRDRFVPDGPSPGSCGLSRRCGCASAQSARGCVFAVHQQRSQSRNAVRRLLAHPHGQSVRECAADRSAD